MLNESCKLYERYANTPGTVAQSLYYYPRWVGHFICNPEFYIKRQGHNDILLLYTLRGCGKMSYRGADYVLNENSIILINCMDLHVYYPVTGSEWEFYFIHFYGNNSLELCEHIYNLNGAVFEADLKIKENMESCIEACRNMTSESEALASKKISDILYALILNVKREERDKIKAVCDYIAENYAKELTTEKLAGVFNFSRSYFSTLFKKNTGTTLYDYLICYRLNKAKTLLTETSFSVEEIAEKTGFKDAGTFIRAFKRKEKITPLQYRKSFLGKDFLAIH